MSTNLPDAVRICELNDAFRRTLCGGKVFFSAGASALGIAFTHLALTRIRAFSDFGADNDPHGEHDFACLNLHGTKLFWKIDYYDLDCRYGSEDPSDPSHTCRILTIMLAEEY